MMFFLVSITLPSSAAAMMLSPGISSVTPKPVQTAKKLPAQTFTVSSEVDTPTIQIETISATSEAQWKKWHKKQLAIVAAKKAAAAAKKAAAIAKKKAAAEQKAAAIAAKKAAAVTATVSNVPVGAKQEYAFTYMASTYGWGSSQQSCLLNLWNRESGWSTTAANASGAYGIPQALPGSKMSSQGSDWATNYKTQIRWGLQYINGSYGSPCSAWAHSNADGWY